MFLDLRQIDQTLIDADLCVIGAGPAGISIALEFANNGVSVCLLESGGFKLNARTQTLCEGEVVGLPYWRPLDEVRYRFFGGSTSKWGAWLAPLNEIDFSRRDWVSYSGWPISFSDMEQYYIRAQELCAVPSFNYDLGEVGFKPGALRTFEQDELVHRLWHFGAPTRFGTLYRRQLKLAQNVRVILHANVTELEADESNSRVSSAKIATLDGKRSLVRAKVFVLASGGLEVPRLLLLSRTTNGTALGNRHDLVGRFFMEHPHIDVASVVLNGDRKWVKKYQLQRLGRRVVRPHLCLPEQKQRELQLVNCSCSIDIPDAENTGYGALRRIKKNIMDPFENESILRNFALMIANPLDLAFGLYTKLTNAMYIPHAPVPRKISLYVRGEQIPDPESRVTLSEKRDCLGLNQVKLDWRMNGEEKRTLRVMSQVLANEFERLGLGEVQLRPWLQRDAGGWPDDLRGGPHHMGTARMDASPTRGVVDQNCRVHGVENLFIAGSAVFPTSGYANPTLTLVALAVRLSDYLKRELSHEPNLSA
jgi:choline dehydrogenase-like flavoprotein